MSLFWFATISIIGIAFLIAVSFTKWSWWTRSAVALAGTIVLTTLMLAPSPRTLGPESNWFNRSPISELVLFGLMLLGMVARVLSVAIDHRNSGEARASEHVKLDRWEFVYPMLFAVPTFGAILNQAHLESLTLQDGILAFQTGFFWQTILKRGEASVSK
jgi:hypothetical protein